MGELSAGRLVKLALRQYKPIRLRTPLWRPGVDVARHLAQLLKGLASSGDVLVLSEKALAVAQGLVFDESSLRPSRLSKLLTLLLMRLVWGFFLGPLCRLKPETLGWIRSYPIAEGARHKQLAIRLGGLAEVLKPSSEAGVDASNLPLSLVALPLPNPQAAAEGLRRALFEELGADLTVVIADSDRMYHHRHLNLALMSRRGPVGGGVYLGFAAFVIGRAFRRAFTPLATPIAIAGRRLEKWTLLGLVELADRLRGFGAGRTVFDAARRFGVAFNSITWSMLESLPHYPAVLFKPRRSAAAVE
ncbi:MAG: coenzyme F420-0:L-glutamate ligase [Candidatus Nezhaarchaeales archaeon]